MARFFAMAKIVVPGLLFLATLAFGLNLVVQSFWGYRDSPWWVYTMWGLFWIGLALVLGGLAWLAAQSSRRHILRWRDGAGFQ